MPSSPALLALLVGAVSLLATAWAVQSYAVSLQREARLSLERTAERIDLIIESRLEACGNLVRAVQLVLAGNPAMAVDEFEARIAALRIERSFPSVQAVAYAQRQVDADGLERYRTTLVAPSRGNEALWGLDVIRQPENLRVLKQALALDEPRLSAPFRLVQHPDPADRPDGFVIRLPLLSAGPPTQDAAQRISRELGSIAVSFRVSRLIDSTLHAIGHTPEFEIRLYADPQDGEQLIYSSAGSGLTPPGHEVPQTGPVAATVEYGGRAWRMQLLPSAAWFELAEREARIAAVLGLLVSALLALLVWALARTRERAERGAARLSLQAQQSERRFRQLSELLPVAAVLARASDGRIDYINAAGRRLLAVSGAQAGSLADYGIGSHATAQGDSLESALTLHAADGRMFPAALDESRVEVDGVAMRLVVIDDVSERMQLTAQLRYQASHDALTGLLNRREFDHRLRLAVEGRDPELATGALLYIDLDQFKLINDTCGHAAGDQLLSRIAQLLKQQLPANAWIARLGGDEFGVLIQADSPAAIRSLGESLRLLIEATPFVWEGRQFGLTASIGAVAFARGGTLPARELLALADTSCYLAKEAGRNRVVVHDEDETAALQRRNEMDWVQRIHQALHEQRFCLCYQELHPLQPGTDDGGAHFELLVRMRDEQGEMVPPGAFIPAAERFGVMPALDRWIVRTALDHFESLHPAGAAIGLCAINLSGATMGDESFPAFLLDQLRRSSVPPQRLCFEITETAAVANFTQAVALIRQLRDLGCKVALDDFGAGMSSFSYLKNLPVDFIKIDGCFIRELETDPMSQSIVRAITEIGHQFEARLVAEFVGRPATCAMLTGIGVDYAQGFGVHVPELSPLYRDGALVG